MSANMAVQNVKYHMREIPDSEDELMTSSPESNTGDANNRPAAAPGSGVRPPQESPQDTIQKPAEEASRPANGSIPTQEVVPKEVDVFSFISTTNNLPNAKQQQDAGADTTDQDADSIHNLDQE